MKKITVFLMSIILGLLSSCGGSDGASSDAEKATSDFLKSYEVYVNKVVETNKQYYELYPKQRDHMEEFKKAKDDRWDLIKEDSNFSKKRMGLFKKRLWDKNQQKKYEDLFMKKASAFTGNMFKKK